MTGPDADIGGENVHKQDGKGYALGIVAEIADDAGHHAAADTEDGLTPGGGGRGDVVGGHKDGTDHQTACQHLGQGGDHAEALHKEGENEDGGDVQHGDLPDDDPTDQQIHAAGDQSDGAGLADGTAVGTQQQGQQIGHLLRRQRGGGGHGVRRGKGGSGHRAEGHQHKHTGGDGGVDQILADAAEQAFHHDDGEQSANDRGVSGNTSADNQLHTNDRTDSTQNHVQKQNSGIQSLGMLTGGNLKLILIVHWFSSYFHYLTIPTTGTILLLQIVRIHYTVKFGNCQTISSHYFNKK